MLRLFFNTFKPFLTHMPNIIQFLETKWRNNEVCSISQRFHEELPTKGKSNTYSTYSNVNIFEGKPAIYGTGDEKVKALCEFQRVPHFCVRKALRPVWCNPKTPAISIGNKWGGRRMLKIIRTDKYNTY